MKANMVPTYPRRSFNEALRSLGFELKVGDDSGGHETWVNRKGQRVKPQATARKRMISHAHAVITAKVLLHMGAVRTTSEFMDLVKRGKDELGRTVRDRVRASEVAARPEVVAPMVAAQPAMSGVIVKRFEAHEKGKRMGRRVDSIDAAVKDKIHKSGEATGGHWVWMGQMNSKTGQPVFRATMRDGKIVVENPRKLLMGGFEGKRAYIQPACGELRCVRPDHMVRGKCAPVVIRETPPPVQALAPVAAEPWPVPVPSSAVGSAVILQEFADRREALEQAIAGFKLSEIAHKLGVSEPYVSQVLLRYGLRFREIKTALYGMGRGENGTPPLVDPRVAEEAAIRRDEEALAQMAAELKTKRERLSQTRVI